MEYLRKMKWEACSLLHVHLWNNTNKGFSYYSTQYFIAFWFKSRSNILKDWKSQRAKMKKTDAMLFWVIKSIIYHSRRKAKQRIAWDTERESRKDTLHVIMILCWFHQYSFFQKSKRESLSTKKYSYQYSCRFRTPSSEIPTWHQVITM